MNDNDIARKKRGRPKADGMKSKRVGLRLTEERYEKLEYLSKATGKSKTDILLKGVDMYESILKSGMSADFLD